MLFKRFISGTVLFACGVGLLSCATKTPPASTQPVAATQSLATGPFLCTRVMGVAIVHEWFDHGFEDHVDNARWEEQAKHGQYLERWRDPNDVVWNEPIVSPCVTNSGNPDRILFQAVNWTYTTADEWVADLRKIIPLLQKKFSNLRRIDLFTLSRSPGNQPCTNLVEPPPADGKPDNRPRRQVLPFVDEALERIAAEFPGMVGLAPKVYTPDCSVYLPASPHWKDEAFPIMAKIYADLYAGEP